MGRDLPRGAPPDDGAADPRLVAALATGDAGRIAAALVDTRLIVGVVALPGEEHASEGDMALALLEAASGARALPAFSSLETLGRWRTDARPVPRPAQELASVALADALDALVVDVAGPVPWTVRDDDLAALAAGYVAAGSGLAGRRGAPVLHAAAWSPTASLRAVCRALGEDGGVGGVGTGVEVYAVDLELPERPGVRTPALGLVLPAGLPPAPVAERLLAADGADLDLLVLEGKRLVRARQVGTLLTR
ncbi:MAG: hypothetical protein QOC98_1344 [Frankiaceae bacterium]|nr:hypothetical protein [Frankiaceae bacterium]